MGGHGFTWPVVGSVHWPTPGAHSFGCLPSSSSTSGFGGTALLGSSSMNRPSGPRPMPAPVLSSWKGRRAVAIATKR